MLRACNSPRDTNDDHMRNLLDQRTARADFTGHARFPSLSEFSDSPSVYSHAYFSPIPPDRRVIEANANSFHFEIPPHRAPAHGEQRFALSNRDRLNDPTASSLDLDDESSTGTSINMHDVDESDTEYGDDAESAHRISLQGPKIRFHSRAPWETGEGPFEDEDSDNSSKSGALGKKTKAKGSKADSLMKTFGRGTSIVSRRSGESSRSQAASKASFEMSAGNYSSSRGALYALAHESLSTSSLSVPSPSSSAPSSAVRQNFSLPRTSQYPPSGYSTSHTQESLGRPANSSRGAIYPSRSSSTAQDIQRSSSPCSDVDPSYDRSTTPLSFHSSQGRPSHDEFVHPYANPDLVMSYTPTPTSISPQRPTFVNVPRSDSSSTVTDTLNSRSAVMSAIAANTSTASLALRDRDQAPSAGMRIQGKDISSPIAVLRANDINASTHATSRERNAKLLSIHPPSVSAGMTALPGWNNQPLSPAVTLISLQEAQARERTRSATANTTTSPHSNMPASSSRIPFPEADEAGKNSGDSGTFTGTRARARSISAGARAKNALHSMVVPQLPKPERQNSEPVDPNSLSGPNAGSSRALKHKKSGFMRLFNGREKEKSLPPPVPSLSDLYSDPDFLQGVQKTRAATLPRVPVPSLSPMEATNGTVVYDEPEPMDQAESEMDEFPTKPQNNLTRKREPPPLFIMTGSPGGRSPASVHESSFQPRTVPGTHLALPSFQSAPMSAPPGTTDFQGLKLRPISTTFSAHFADIVASPEDELTQDFELELPSSGGSSSIAFSPLTPGSSRRSDEKQPVIDMAQSDQSLVVKTLQEQMTSAKKAWQQQLWELQGQVRDLQAEIEELRSTDEQGHCDTCGRGTRQKQIRASGADTETKKLGVVNRPRARTGDAARFGSGH
ncbi:hypothetical protein BJ138DRAFT_1125102 [Hygrophoropsis aurantiaca]|uniref:Uncharacterized protein n=1 Tax=Hygrophoropsis aurantiaca TaxID=72124 RepID=A0ACB8AGA5_9AGAM|nr:hypothetical protein BJ138DRAFT_1125102 [Hygrophoropsis aurantiaca]